MEGGCNQYAQLVDNSSASGNNSCQGEQGPTVGQKNGTGQIGKKRWEDRKKNFIDQAQICWLDNFYTVEQGRVENSRASLAVRFLMRHKIEKIKVKGSLGYNFSQNRICVCPLELQATVQKNCSFRIKERKIASFLPNLANCLMYWKPMEKTGVFVFIVGATVRLIADSIFQLSLAKKIRKIAFFGRDKLWNVVSVFVDWYSNKKVDGVQAVPKLRNRRMVKVFAFPQFVLNLPFTSCWMKSENAIF